MIDKPEGITSHDVVARVRRAASTRRVGHAGTLDPFATGVLVVCVGRATRLAQFLVGLDKQYLATVRFGFATDTQDLTGKQITPLVSSNELSLEGLESALVDFRGAQLQTPPMFSAKKIGGETLHRLARAGREVERKPVPITVYSVELEAEAKGVGEPDVSGTRDFVIRVRCSSGTYVRTLAHDIGQRLGVGAHLAALRRTAVGHFGITGALTLDEVERLGAAGELGASLVAPAEMLRHLESVRMDSVRINRAVTGREIELTEYEAARVSSDSAALRLLSAGGELIAVGEYDPARKSVRPRVVLG